MLTRLFGGCSRCDRVDFQPVVHVQAGLPAGQALVPDRLDVVSRRRLHLAQSFGDGFPQTDELDLVGQDWWVWI